MVGEDVHEKYLELGRWTQYLPPVQSAQSSNDSRASTHPDVGAP